MYKASIKEKSVFASGGARIYFYPPICRYFTTTQADENERIFLEAQLAVVFWRHFFVQNMRFLVMTIGNPLLIKNKFSLAWNMQ